MKKIDLFGNVMSYTPNLETDVSLMEIINHNIQYEKERKEFNKKFFHGAINCGDTPNFLKEEIEYLIDNLDITALDDESKTHLKIESFGKNIDIRICLSINKNDTYPHITLSNTASEASSILGNILLKHLKPDTFMELFRINSLKRERPLTLTIDNIPITVCINPGIGSTVIKINYKDNNYTIADFDRKGFKINETFKHEYDETDEITRTIQENLEFFLKNTYVKTSLIPKVLLSYPTENIAETFFEKDKTAEKMDDTDYYFEVANQIKKLEDLKSIDFKNDTEYHFTFIDESILIIPSNRVFKVVNARHIYSMAEKQLKK